MYICFPLLWHCIEIIANFHYIRIIIIIIILINRGTSYFNNLQKNLLYFN